MAHLIHSTHARMPRAVLVIKGCDCRVQQTRHRTTSCFVVAFFSTYRHVSLSPGSSHFSNSARSPLARASSPRRACGGEEGRSVWDSIERRHCTVSRERRTVRHVTLPYNLKLIRLATAQFQDCAAVSLCTA